ncbi:DMSO/TMAO reductase YedYZ molybdopterin-dependent catalytic subunit [Frondihabitans sp. PhB188]|uniref:molybdopterin-dependent oxidoreductase n=1 Tax=Frondihabitans sp. PhB188 TaxID=2485200 RepID=UPI000F468E21|nr:molybdopterin-dependent oxidoreductase [Frondihabitans sp. PhB188]ROQ40673.1 DMSO/TMAO reductase YedYZ molybdopterin-dependent catalytic subunit [Frondihabitans sp. PhB188]
MSTRVAPPVAAPPAAAVPSSRALKVWAALGGVLALIAFLASAEAVAVVIGAGSSPLVGVGGAVIDLAPPGAKNLMVALFGTGDKAALFALMGVLLVIITAGAGLLERSRPPLGRVVFGVGGLLAILAVRTRAGAGNFDIVPSLVGAIVATLVLHAVIARLFRWEAAARYDAGEMEVRPKLSPAMRSSGLERRAFFRWTALSAAAWAVVGAGARVINGAVVNAEALRAAVKLPAAAVTEDAAPAGASLSVAGITPYITPNADFYRIDTALSVPQIDPSTWSLQIEGLVETPITLTWKQLLDLPLVEHTATLSCVSNEVGGDLIGNARWLGYPIRELLKRGAPDASADMVLSRSIDGFTAGTPLSVLQDDSTQALLAIGMNGEPLPLEHGFPVRMVVPGLFGYVSATKWVTSLKVTRFADEKAYWSTRGWTEKGPAKLESRIDTPSGSKTVSAGTVPIAGVAWEPHTGVAAVEIRVDNGDWVEATLADSISDDTWRQWVYRWDATKGRHRIQVRATSKDGKRQTAKYVPPAPDGAEGWDEVTVTVA